MQVRTTSEPAHPNLKDRVAIVTGGAGCLGRAVALCLRDHDCRVIVVDRDTTALDDLGDQPGIAAIACDLLDPDATERCLSAAWDRFGPISILVNAVGLIHNALLVDLSGPGDRRHTIEAWRQVIDTNLTAVFLVTVNLVERMASTRTRGVVINFSSVAATGNAGQGAYSAAKAGVNALTRAWAKELGPLGIRFVAIAPGFVDTPTTRRALAEATLADWVRRTPLRRLASVDDVTSAVLFCISNEYLTGKVIEIDGGLTL